MTTPRYIRATYVIDGRPDRCKMVMQGLYKKHGWEWLKAILTRKPTQEWRDL